MPSPDETDWGQFGLADIWDMLKYDDFNNGVHYKAWEKMRILCHGMADSLRQAAAELAAQWPPEHSPAAAAFKERLDALAVTFTTAGDAAGTNGPVLNDANLTLAVAHGQISELRRQWDRTRADVAARANVARTVLGGGMPIVNGLSDDNMLIISNTWPASSLVDLNGAPRVANNWKQELDNQARAVMATGDRKLAETRTEIAEAPVLFPAYSDTIIGWDPNPPGGGGSSFTGAGSSRGASDTGGFIPPPPRPLPPGQPERDPTPDDTILDSTPMPGSPNPGGMPPGWTPGGAPPGTGPVPLGTGPIPWVMTPGGRAIAPGGVIGDPVTSTARVPLGGQAVAGAPATRPAALGTGNQSGFVAPPGGLIGGRPQGRGGAPVSGASRRRRPGDEDDGWVMPAGVPGVLMPDPEPEIHDPGPGVIGIDR